MKGQVNKIKVNTRDELHVRIVDSAARIKEHEDQLPRSSYTSCKVY
jgi:hypothetical protein